MQLTDRQLEALCMAAVTGSALRRYRGYVCRHGGPVVETNLYRAALLANCKLTLRGCYVLEQNMGKLPAEIEIDGKMVSPNDVVRDAIVARRTEIDDEKKRAEQEKEARAQRAAEIKAARNAKIAPRMREIFAEQNVALGPFIRPDARKLDGVLVEIWNSIVSADCAL